METVNLITPWGPSKHLHVRTNHSHAYLSSSLGNSTLTSSDWGRKGEQVFCPPFTASIPSSWLVRLKLPA